MILTSTSDIIRIVTSSTADVHAQTSWADITTTVFTPGRTNTVITSATTTTIVASPGASTQRQIKTIVIYNAHASTANTVTIQHYDGTTSNTVYKYTLAAAESIEYNGANWIQFDANGSPKSTTSLGILTSAQLAAALTDETGTGSVVFGTSPTFTTNITTPKITFNSTSGVVGTTTNDSAATGSVGEWVSSVILFAGKVSLTNATQVNVTSIPLTAGDWNVWGSSWFNLGSGTLVTAAAAGISTTSAILPGTPADGGAVVQFADTTYSGTNNLILGITPTRISVPTTTTVYLVGYAEFTVSTLQMFGAINARRVR